MDEEKYVKNLRDSEHSVLPWRNTLPYTPNSTDSDTGFQVLIVLLGMRCKSCTTDTQKDGFSSEGEDTKAAGDPCSLGTCMLRADLHWVLLSDPLQEEEMSCWVRSLMPLHSPSQVRVRHWEASTFLMAMGQ